MRRGKRQGMKVSLFDRLVPKGAGEQKRKLFSSAPQMRRYSALDAACGEAMERYPEDGKTIENFSWALKETCRVRYKKAADGELQPMKAAAQFFLSQDRMSAFGCLLPPENGGDEITLEEFMEDLHYEGINYGILREEIQREFGRGYLRIFPVARGKPPQEGEDGKVVELFKRRKTMQLEVQNGSQVDFGEDVQLQPIRKGTAVCLIRPPRAGADGMDVTGQKRPVRPAVKARIPQGENTVIGRGGQALIAEADGILYIENDQFCIHAQKIIDGDMDQFQGTLRISGNLYIGGTVDGGVDIEASGDIVINGKLGRARVVSTGGTIRIQQGVYGTQGETRLTAACQVQAPVMEWAEIEAGTSVIADAILNSSIRCGGTVYVMSGRGMIVDSHIQAGDSILCLRIGNLAGGRSQVSVGYPPHIPEAWKRLKAELSSVQSVVEKLWEPITTLRKKGYRITDGERELLEQLAEQRSLYLEKKEALAAELKLLEKELDKKSRGRIRCEKLYPHLEVQIGRLTEEITTIEEQCDIHVEENRIQLQ